MKKINFKQPKYIFPLVVFVPLCCLVYFVSQTFGGGKEEETVATDRINATLPEANAEAPGNKLFEMSRRYGDEDAFTAVGKLGEEREEEEYLGHGYSDEELDRIDAAEAERIRQQQEIEELERSLAESRRHINSYAYGGENDFSGSYNGYSPDHRSEYMRDLEAIQQRSYERQKAIEDGLGIGKPDPEEIRQKEIADSIAREREIEREKNRPLLVLKSKETNSEKFNTVGGGFNEDESPLIRAMIDQTTKAHEGTRLRFKLLDDVTIHDVSLKKGTYLYGTVSGFGQQRVRANISSILVGSRFIKVNLSVFDNDGMEGFYVPESAFRDFMKEAGASTVQQNINFDTGSSYGSGISGEAIALQALQNLYNSATSAVSANIRKNKAKIKYNTIVYLINSDDAR
ncbi:MAG: conjugative transposon protein TraM [Muribaculaceae bacterium]|nr:conjugative transposon protein TraM [Muribaculaceae bacterium]